MLFRSERVPVAQLKEGQTSVFEAMIDNVPSMNRRGKLSYLRARLSDDTGSVNAIWFNQPWIAEQLRRGERYIFRGKIEDGGRQRSVSNPDFRTLEVAAESSDFFPIYPLTAGLYQGNIRHAVTSALKHRNFFIEESLPHEVRVTARLATADYALRRIHYPSSEHEVDIARRRLAFEELFLVVAGLRALKVGRENEKGPAMNLGTGVMDRLQQLIKRLPFELTPSQQKTLDLIVSDFRRSIPGNRLVQGDVGSGKTVVAVADRKSVV